MPSSSSQPPHPQIQTTFPPHPQGSSDLSYGHSYQYPPSRSPPQQAYPAMPQASPYTPGGGVSMPVPNPYAPSPAQSVGYPYSISSPDRPSPASGYPMSPESARPINQSYSYPQRLMNGRDHGQEEHPPYGQPASQPHAVPAPTPGQAAIGASASQPVPNGQSGPPGHHFPVHQGHHGVMAESDEQLTEEELIEYEKGIMTWQKAKNWRFWIRKEWTWYYVALVVIVVVVGLMAFFHHSIINWLTPFTKRLEGLTAGWLIPVAILFILSFPPLFGNEIVMILVGIVWGLGVGFAIVAIGVGLGEIANYFVFKYWCSARANRIAKKNLNYACIAQVIREGGFWMAFTIRLSVIPTHVSTVLFAVCGLKFWQYTLALIAGLPKQLIAVYIGVVLGGTTGDSSGHTSTAIISDCVFAATALITLWSLWYIYKKMVGVRRRVLLDMRTELVGKGVKVGEVPGEIMRDADAGAREEEQNGREGSFKR